MKPARLGCCLGLIGVALGVAAAQTAADVQLRIVKYEGLSDAVLKNRGKVVLVDFWGNF